MKIRTDEQTDLTQGKYVATFDGIDLYQYRIDSINATCIGGSKYGAYSTIRILDCKYD